MKKFSIKNMKVKNKLTFFSAVALIIILIIAMTGITVLSLTNKARSRRYLVYGDRELALSDCFTYFNQVKIDIRNMIYLYDDESQQEEKQQAIDDIEEQFALAYQQVDLMEVYKDQYSQEIQSGIEEIRVCLQEYSDSADKIKEYINTGDMEAAELELLNGGMVTANKAQGVLEELMQNLLDEAAVESVKIDQEVQILSFALIAICVVSFIILGCFCLSLINQIAVPIGKLSEASRKLALGDIDVSCEKINDDDLGILMDEFQQMADAIKSQAQVMDVVSKGDLTVEVSPRGDRDVLGIAMQRLVSDDNKILGNIKESSMQVTTGAEQVSNASQSLAQGSTEQASALEQVTASITDIAERTKVNASQANEANDLVQNVKERAADGNAQMKSMIGAMNDINKSSETISKIIKTIDDIAFQTNILALNAAVEAARAGVHGKGFAVVAEEVRNLAAKSASAASETAEMIEDSIHRVEHGTKLAEETEKSLDEIVQAINKIVELIGNIAVASNDQATAVSQIDQAIGQVSTVVHTNSATSEQCAAASEELFNQAANLRQLLGHYKLLTGMGLQEPALDMGSSNTYSSSGSFGGNSYSNDNYSSNNNEQIIALDDKFGKY